MRLKQIQLQHILILVCAISIIALLFICAFEGSSGQTGTVIPVHIVGNYRIDGQETHVLTEDTTFDNDALHTITISGHLSLGIPEGWVLMLRMDNIRVSMSINGQEVYRFGEEESTPDISKTAGNKWGLYISPGIAETDDVKITLQNVYADTITNMFEEFLGGMSYGHGFELYQTLISEKMPSILFGSIIFVTGMIVLVICMVAALLKAPGMGRGMALACVTMTGGIWIAIDGGYPYVSLLFDNPLLFNTIDVLQIFIISVVLVIFTFACLENKITRKLAAIITNVSLALLAFAVLAQIAGVYDLYEIQNWAIAIGCIIALAAIVLLGYEALMLKHRQSLFVLLSWLPLFASAFLEVINYYVRFMPERMAIQYGFTLSLLLQFIQLVQFIRKNINRMQKAARLEKEILENRIAIMLSQIQPHFLYNSLESIRYLCRKDPEVAEKATIDFARYLRANMDSLNRTQPISFYEELSHVKNYISLELLRFNERLHIVYDIETTNFFVPALSLQPIVENAIRHGVMKREEGGTIKISTKETDGAYLITVADDGPGFSSEQKEDGRSRIGINNVRARLEAQCGGSLTIQSCHGENTTVIITIPKGEGYESHCG